MQQYQYHIYVLYFDSFLRVPVKCETKQKKDETKQIETIETNRKETKQIETKRNR